MDSVNETGTKTHTTFKRDVIVAVSEIIIRLGKNDINGVRNAFLRASKMFEKWVMERPEKNFQS